MLAAGPLVSLIAVFRHVAKNGRLLRISLVEFLQLVSPITLVRHVARISRAPCCLLLAGARTSADGVVGVLQGLVTSFRSLNVPAFNETQRCLCGSRVLRELERCEHFELLPLSFGLGHL